MTLLVGSHDLFNSTQFLSEVPETFSKADIPTLRLDSSGFELWVRGLASQ